MTKIQVEVNKDYWHRTKGAVKVLGEPDQNDKVPCLLNDGSYGLVKSYDLEVLPEHRFKCWWNKENFTILKIGLNGSDERMIIPRDQVFEIRKVMSSKKQGIRTGQKPEGEDSE